MNSPRCRARIHHSVSLLIGCLVLASGLAAQSRIAPIPIPFEVIRELGDAKSDRHTLVFRTQQGGWSFHGEDGPIPFRNLPRMNRIVLEVDALADHVHVRLAGHEPVTIPLNRMDIGRRQDFELQTHPETAVRSNGRLHVTVSPLDAKMDVVNSIHPLRNGLNELPEGSHMVRITHPAHLEERRMVWVEQGRMRSVEWVLTPRVEQSFLQVRTDPESVIFVNGREIGEGSAYVGVQPVPHRVEIRHPAGSRRLTVTPNSSGITDVPIFALADRSSSLIRSGLFPGAGHLHAGDVRGYWMGGVTMAALVTGLAFNLHAMDMDRSYDGARFIHAVTVDPIQKRQEFRNMESYRDRRDRALLIATVGFGAAAALHIGQFTHLLMYEPPFGWRAALEINPQGPLIRVEW